MWPDMRNLLSLAIAVMQVARTDMAAMIESCDFSSNGGPFCEDFHASCTRQLMDDKKRGLLDCTRGCCSDDSCIGVSLDSAKLCYYHEHCSAPTSCGGPHNIIPVTYYAKSPCENGGRWLVVENRCQCIGGWVGSWCERHPVNCLELVTYKYTPGLYWVDIKLSSYSSLINTKCFVHSNFANTAIYQGNGQLDNQRPWSEYRDGFTGDENNFWLGLEKIHKFTSSGLQYVGFDVVFDYLTYTSVLWRYRGFTIGNEATKFRLSVGSATTNFSGTFTTDYQVTVEDCFTPMKNAKFSTFDNDNDDDSALNCAAKAGTGWWFKTCNFICNPLGKNYVTSPSSVTLDKNLLLAGLDFTDPRYWNKFLRIEMYFVEECIPPSKCGLP